MQLQQLVSEREDLGAFGDGGAMPLKPTTVVMADSTRGGGRRREVKVAGAR
jgi:hypothetical protein